MKRPVILPVSTDGPIRKKRSRFVQGEYKLNSEERVKYKGTYPIIYRSSYELAFIQFCCRTSDILSWGSESTIVYYKDTGRNNTLHRYYIDFTISLLTKERKVQKYLIEIKPHHETIPPKVTGKRNPKSLQKAQQTYITNQCKWKEATKYAHTKGYLFKVLTEKELFQDIKPLKRKKRGRK